MKKRHKKAVVRIGFRALKDLDKLILDILPNVLDEDQKKNKLRNIIYAMSKRDVSITNTGTNRKPIWKKV